MACVPANLASVLYNKTEGEIVTLAVNTLGVLYIVENGNAVQSMADLAGKTIVAAGKGSTPEYALRYLLSENGIDPNKDVDAFHPVNVGHIMIGDYRFLPCTPAGIMELLKAYDIDPKGRECVVIGRSNIVGKPMALMLLHRNATVTVCHSKTRDLPSVTRRADVLISAVGKAGFVTAGMVKPGAVVIDVGMNRNQAGKLCGDVDFESVSRVAGYLTPVPGGVGPMTITMLLWNTLAAARRRAE